MKMKKPLGWFLLPITSTIAAPLVPLPCPEYNTDLSVIAASWEFKGPATYVPIEGLGVGDEELAVSSAGAIQKAVEASNGAWLAGTVNGGIWRTTSDFGDPDALIEWKSVTDQQPVRCSSISALITGAAVGRPEVVLAGCGASTSSEQGADWNVVNSGGWGGLMISMDNGDSWVMHEGVPVNYYITSIQVLANSEDEDDLQVLVSVRSHFFDRNDGGIWRGPLNPSAAESWERVLSSPVFETAVSDAASSNPTVLAACPYDGEATVIQSSDGGGSWKNASEGIDWGSGDDGVAMQPFYPSVVLSQDGAVAFLGALTVHPREPTTTSSKLFYRQMGDAASSTWIEIAGGPSSLDDDAMPKDRFAVLPDPDDASLIYVVGNGDHIAWRVQLDFSSDGSEKSPALPSWTSLLGEDTVDDREPHCDCRNLAFHRSSNSSLAASPSSSAYSERLVLVSDGGIFCRDGPRASGGTWRSLNGNIGAMEFVDAHLDPISGRWIAGAQDNDVQISDSSAPSKVPAEGVVMGDGTVTAVDIIQGSEGTVSSRLFGCRQFLGQAQDDQRRRRRSRRLLTDSVKAEEDEDDEENDDDDWAGLRYVEYKASKHKSSNADADNDGTLPIVVDIPLDDHFLDQRQFPYFVQPFVVNAHAKSVFNGSKLVFWGNSSLDGSQKAGFYEYQIQENVADGDEIPPPVLLSETSPGTDVYVISAGGIVAVDSGAQVYANRTTVEDPDLLVGLTQDTLLVRSQIITGSNDIESRPLPADVSFAAPLNMDYDESGEQIVGPVSHAKTVSLALAPTNARVIAVTGWPGSITDNSGGCETEPSCDLETEAPAEVILLSWDAGLSWVNIMGDLAQTTATVGKTRPSGLLVFEGMGNGAVAVVVGTTSGVYVSFISNDDSASTYTWSRLGTCEEFPLVYNMNLSYEETLDTIVAATMGRGVYTLRNATAVLKQKVAAERP